MSIEPVMPSNHLILCQPPFLLGAVFSVSLEMLSPGFEVPQIPTKLNKTLNLSVQFSSVAVTSNSLQPDAARQISLSITNSQSLLKLMSIDSVMPSNHLILCRPLLLLPSIFPSFRVFTNESVLRIRWPKYWSFSFSTSPSNEYSGLISFRTD